MTAAMSSPGHPRRRPAHGQPLLCPARDLARARRRDSPLPAGWVPGMRKMWEFARAATLRSGGPALRRARTMRGPGARSIKLRPAVRIGGARSVAGESSQAMYAAQSSISTRRRSNGGRGLSTGAERRETGVARLMGRSASLFGPLSQPTHMRCSSLFRTGLTSSVRLCENLAWNNEEQRSEQVNLRRITHPGTDANLDGWLSPCAARPTTPLAGIGREVRPDRAMPAGPRWRDYRDMPPDSGSRP